MESINSEKWRVRFSIVAIFLLGFVGGGLAVNLYNHAKPSDKSPPFGHRGGIEATLKGLNLTDEQWQQVNQILGDTRQKLMEIHRASEPQVLEIRKQSRERLKTVLTDEQWNKFQEQMKAREKEWENRGDRSDHPDRPHRRPFFEDPGQSPTPEQ